MSKETISSAMRGGDKDPAKKKASIRKGSIRRKKVSKAVKVPAFKKTDAKKCHGIGGSCSGEGDNRPPSQPRSKKKMEMGVNH